MFDMFVAFIILSGAISIADNIYATSDQNNEPSRTHPYLMPPTEKQRLLELISTNPIFHNQYEKIKERAETGNLSDSALVFALEGGEKYSNIVRNHLLQLVEYRSPSLDEDILAGGHREGNMDFYWDTSEIRAYDLVYQSLTNEERQKIETFYRKLGNYWKDSKGGFYPASVQLTSELMDYWTFPLALPITIGAVLVEDNSFPTFGEYVIYAPKYILRISKRYGTSRFLRDDNGRPRYEATFWDRRPTAYTTPDALPRLSIDGKDILAWGIPASFIWTNSFPASITVGTNGGRITWAFEDDAIKIEPVALWSAEATHEFIFPGHNRLGWVTWEMKPEWMSIVSSDESGEIKVFSKPESENQRTLSTALMVPGYDEAICFVMDRPQIVKIDDTTIRIFVNPGEPIWFGLSNLDEFDNWWRSRAIQKK